METPLPDDYNVDWYNNWWKDIGTKPEQPVAENWDKYFLKLIDMLNLNISFRDFTVLIIKISMYKTFFNADDEPDLKDKWHNVDRKFKDKLDILHYGALTMGKSVDIISAMSNAGGFIGTDRLLRYPLSYKKIGEFVEKSSTDKKMMKYGDAGLGNFIHEWDSHGVRKYIKHYLTMLFCNDMFEGNKTATHNDLLKGKLLCKEVVNWKPHNENWTKRTLYQFMYLEPVRPGIPQQGIFQFNYRHKDDRYYRVKNGRPYRLHKWNITINTHSPTRKLKTPQNSDGFEVLDKGGNNIIANKTFQNFQHQFNQAITNRLSAKEIEKYRKATTEGSSLKTYFIPDTNIVSLWSKAKSEALVKTIKMTKNQELQMIDVLKASLETNYASDKADLDYFGDVQGLEIMDLNKINITGYKVKSNPVHYLNWLKDNNPLGGEK